MTRTDARIALIEDDADLADEVRQRMFVFEDIVTLDDRSIQLVLRQVDAKDLTVALKGVRPEVREKICDYKADADQWLRVHREWHELGGKSNATMLYGHIETAYHRIDHLIRLRELQDETGGFQTFIPLAFHPDNTGLSHIQKPSGVMDLRTMAISRLMLDNFPHIKAYWVMLGIKTAQVALSWTNPGDADFSQVVILRKTADLLIARKREIAELITAESGLCLKDTIYEVGRAYDVFFLSSTAVIKDDGEIFASPMGVMPMLGVRLANRGARIVLDPSLQGTHLKAWTFGEMVRTDFAGRGVPWIDLLLAGGGEDVLALLDLGPADLGGDRGALVDELDDLDVEFVDLGAELFELRGGAGHGRAVGGCGAPLDFARHSIASQFAPKPCP